ncbi:MAG TPA: hypothetical protein PLN76_09870 [Saprospiraceae bacterium]|nr:hypothetical protein [Saprospiraceae bacterium]
MIKFVSVGQTYKAHGVKGEIFAELNEGLEKYVFKAGVVFIKVDGCPVPFFIQSHRDEGRLFLKFEDVNDPEYARKISGTTIYLDEKSLPSNIRDKEHFKSALNELDGYTIVDEDSKKELKIISVEEFPSQILAKVMYQNKEILLPIHENFITHLDETKKILHMNLPSGILEL